MKTLTKCLAAAMAFSLFLTFRAPAAESLSTLLQRGIYAEETEGNLDSAIGIYEQIAAEGAASRDLVAQAQYRLAVCYQKKGNQGQAVAVLNALLQLSPNDPTWRERANALLRQLGAGATDTNAPVIRRLPLAKSSWTMSVSADGRLVAYMPIGTSSNIYVFEIPSGKSWLALKTSELNSPWSVHFSPDNRQIAYDTSGTSLWVANVDGSAPKLLYKPTVKGTVWPLGWSPRTGEIIAGTWEAETNKARAFRVDPVASRMVPLPVAPRTGSDATLSRSGDYLALREGRDLFVINLATGHEETVVEDQAVHVNGWGNNDAELIFTGDRTGSQGIWTVAIKAGRRVGVPRLVKQNAEEISVTGVTRDGIIFYDEYKKSAMIRVAEVDFSTGRVDRAPRLATERFPGTQSEAAWSADGRRLWIAIQGEQRRFVSLAPASGKFAEVPVAGVVGNYFRQFSWSKDDGFVLLQGRKTKGPSPIGLHRFDLASGKIETVVAKPGDEWICQPRLTPDQKAFYFIRRKFVTGADHVETWTDRIVRRTLDADEEHTVYASADNMDIWAGFAVAPEGDRLAMVMSDQFRTETFVASLRLLQLEEGRTRELLRLEPREKIESLSWTPDGSRIVYVKSIPSVDGLGLSKNEIWSLSVANGDAVRLDLEHADVSRIALHPDGKQLAYRTGMLGDEAELWVMENAIPPLSAESEDAHQLPLAPTTRLRLRPGDLLGSANTISDRTLGVTASLPAGWGIRQAHRYAPDQVALWPEGFTGMQFELPDATVDARLAYSIYEGSRPMAGVDAKQWLREFAARVSKYRRESGLEDYRHREDSFGYEMVDGSPALRWVAEHSKDGFDRLEYCAAIRNSRGHVFVTFTVPASKPETFRPAIDELVRSVKLPK